MKPESGGHSLSQTQNEVNEWMSRIAQSLPEFRDRAGQREMIELVRQVFSRARQSDVVDESGRSLLVVEGPTGTGKSLAYLLPGIIMAMHLDKRLIVSSVTVGLQEQLASKDIPFLEAHSGWPLSHGIAKGRGRYVCERDLALFADGGMMAPSGAKDLLQKMEKALGNTWDGDRDSWPGGMDDRIFSLVANRAESCSGMHCQYYEDCLYFKNRKLLENVDVVVTNHDLLLADSLLGGGVVLPSPGSSLLVVDEAHHLPKKATEAFLSEINLESSLVFLSEIPAAMANGVAVMGTKEVGSDVVACQEAVVHLSPILSDISHFLEKNWPAQLPRSSREESAGIFSGGGEQSTWRFPRGVLPERLRSDLFLAHEHFAVLRTSLSRLRDALSQRLSAALSGSDRLMERGLLETGGLLRRVSSLIRFTETIVVNKGDEPGPTAVWAQRTIQGGLPSFSLHAGPVMSGGLLKELVWSRFSGGVATSATLTALGSFDHFLSQSGLSLFPEVTVKKLDSPFDHERQGVLTIPYMDSDPTDSSRHTREVARWIDKRVHPQEGTLVLFSSRRQMEDVRGLLSSDVLKRLLVQGSLSRESLLATHQERIERGEGSILFGLASLAEGLDLKGGLLTHVVIVRIPFSPPTEPIGEAYSEWLEDHGGNSFRQIQLPQASLRLIQAVGRLIRSETDWGVVSILDRRVVSKSYGRHLLKSLPPFPVKIENAGEDFD
jgi:ATP-dependent DNA helicase DinG